MWAVGRREPCADDMVAREIEMAKLKRSVRGGEEELATSAVVKGTGDGHRTESTGARLTEGDARHLATYEAKLQLIRDRVRAVAEGYSTGLFVYGPGGVSKSYTVLAALQEAQANYRLLNSRLTGRGLVDQLERFPDSVVVVEDAESIFADKTAVGVLRSALWGQRRDGNSGPVERWVTWSAHRVHKEFLFSGGVIVISNRPLIEAPELTALKTRVPYLLLQPTDNELRAMMRSVAARGYELAGQVMTTDECGQVAEFVIGESLSLHRPLDLRLLIGAFGDYLQWSAADAGVHWRDLVAARIRERPPTFRYPVATGPREDRLQAERTVAREILASGLRGQEAVRSWKERTEGSSQAAFYRRCAEVRGR